MSPRHRSAMLFIAKAAFTMVLIVWLVRSGVLDFAALAIMVRRPWLLALDLALFAFNLTMVTLRWRLLLDLADVKVPLRRLFQLQLAAGFFNVVIPSGMGGDVLKALYVARDAAPNKRPTILLLVVVEALVSLLGLLAVACLVTVIRAPSWWQEPRLRALAFGVGALCASVVIGPTLFVLAMRRSHGRLEVWVARLDMDVLTRGPSRLAKALNQWVAVHRLLSRLLLVGPKKMTLALALSMLISGAVMGFFTVLTRVILDRDVPYSAVAMIFPFGILTTMLPLSPAGLGVGHVAFERLFAWIGLSGGATIFNVYFIGRIMPCLVGVFPYLALRKNGAIPKADEEAPRS